ncbi:MAG TPA: EamA family transporter, partial [Stellaceae bacterium]|nr:EamA family transporter [Stellaceae bacterium]
AHPSELWKLVLFWRGALLAGLAGVAGSACWFTAMTLQEVAYVRTLGTIELLFTLLSSYLLFKERPSRAELVGVALVLAGTVLVLNPG